MPMGPHQAFPGPEFTSVLRLCPQNFRRHDSRCDCAGDLMWHFVLDGENMFESAVVTIGPDVVSIGCVDQLRSDADAIPGFSDAAFKHIADAKFASYLANVDRFGLVGKRRISCDDEQPTRPRQ